MVARDYSNEKGVNEDKILKSLEVSDYKVGRRLETKNSRKDLG